MIHESNYFVLGSLSTKSDIENASTEIRERLGISDAEIKKLHTDVATLDYWIRKLEQANILVFKSITNTGWRTSYKTIRGSSAFYPRYPWILINSQEHARAQLFTLGHELAHILLKGNSICVLEEGKHDPSSANVESYCNQFSAALHIPEKLFKKFVQIRGLKFSKPQELNYSIGEIKKEFHISAEASARRLHTLGYASWKYYQNLRQIQIQELDKERAVSKKGGNGKYHNKRIINWNGTKYTHLVLEGYRQNYISLGEAAQSLRTKVSHFEKIERAMYQ